MKRRLRQISAWVDPELKQAFHFAATENNTSESLLLNRLLAAFLKRNLTAPIVQLNQISEIRDARVTIRLTAQEEKELIRRAESRAMTKSRYIAALFRSHVSSSPYFSETELNALRELSRHLAAIGKNINQIAKALNTSLENAHIAQAIDLAQVNDLIEKERGIVVRLIKENMQSWTSNI